MYDIYTGEKPVTFDEVELKVIANIPKRDERDEKKDNQYIISQIDQAYEVDPQISEQSMQVDQAAQIDQALQLAQVDQALQLAQIDQPAQLEDLSARFVRNDIQQEPGVIDMTNIITEESPFVRVLEDVADMVIIVGVLSSHGYSKAEYNYSLSSWLLMMLFYTPLALQYTPILRTDRYKNIKQIILQFLIKPAIISSAIVILAINTSIAPGSGENCVLWVTVLLILTRRYYKQFVFIGWGVLVILLWVCINVFQKCNNYRQIAPRRLIRQLSTREASNADAHQQCSICITDYNEGDQLKVLPCKHIFHTNCIDPWLANHNVCPNCRHNIMEASANV